MTRYSIDLIHEGGERVPYYTPGEPSIWTTHDLFDALDEAASQMTWLSDGTVRGAIVVDDQASDAAPGEGAGLSSRTGRGA